MKTQYREKYRGSGTITFADPLNHQNTVATKVSTKVKAAGSQRVYNVNSSIRINRDAVIPQPKDCKDKCTLDKERLTANLSLSGSTSSQTEMLVVINDLQALLVAWKADLLAGFTPNSIPELGTA